MKKHNFFLTDKQYRVLRAALDFLLALDDDELARRSSLTRADLVLVSDKLERAHERVIVYVESVKTAQVQP
jgi:DNA-binding MarR family transcriptional regulator